MDIGDLTRSLDLLSERVGDPASLVYAELFRRNPELESLFLPDTNGDVRGEMLFQAFDLLLRAEAGDQTCDVLVRANRFAHDGYGVSEAQFNAFFSVMRDVTKQVLGPDWTEKINRQWTEAIERLSG